MSDRQQRIKALFNSVVELASPEDQAEYLAKHCADDELRSEVLGLVAHDQELGRFMERTGEQMMTVAVPPVAAESLISRQIGPYTIREQIGEGGMGHVYVAEQKKPLRHKVALKVIKPGMATKDVVARFEAERQALAMMDHPNIARVFDGGATSDGQPYFVMELVQGQPIDEYCDDAKFSITDRLQLFICVCRAVQHAHQKGIIHRDLKPSNILVAVEVGVPTVKVIDFGIAKALEHDLTDHTRFTRFAELVGTPVYMSPEQAAITCLDIDTRSDVYSLGVLLYELLVGATPFDAQTLKSSGLDELRRIIREDDPLRPSQKVKSLDDVIASNQSAVRGTGRRQLMQSLRRELDWIVMKALDKDRTHRYESASALAEDISRYLDNAPVLACPPSMSNSLRKWTRRNRVFLSIAGTVLFALIAISGVLIWQKLEVRRAWQASLMREQQAQDLLEAANFQAAVSAFRQGDLSRISDATRRTDSRLSDSRPYSFQNMLVRTGNPVALNQLAHQDAVFDFSVSQNSQRLVSVDAAGRVYLWDMREAKNAHLLGTHDEPAHAVAISPDGERAVSGSTSGKVWFWDLEKRTTLAQLQPTGGGIESLVWSPDGKHVAGGARYNSFWVCDSDGNLQFQFKNDNRHESLLFSSDSKTLYVPTRRSIDKWDVESRKLKGSFSTQPIENVRGMCLAGPQRKWLLAGARFSETIVVLDAETGKRLGMIAAGTHYAQDLDASPDGRWVAATYKSGGVQLIELTESSDQVAGAVKLQFNPDSCSSFAPEEPRWTVGWLGEGHAFLTSSCDGKIRLWDLEGIRPTRNMPGVERSKSIKQVPVAYPVGGGTLVYYAYGSGTGADGPRHVDYLGNVLSTARLPIKLQTQSASHDGKRIAVAGAHEVMIVEFESGEIVGRFPSSYSPHRRATLAANGTVLATTSNDYCVAVWQTKDGWRTAQKLGEWRMTLSIRPPVIADDGKSLIIQSENRDGISEWDLHSGQETRKYGEWTGEAGYALAYRHRWLAAAVQYGIRVYDRESGEVRNAFDARSEVTALAFLGDDRVLISGHSDQSIRAWHLRTSQPLGVLHKPTNVPGKPVHIRTDAEQGRVFVAYEHNAAVKIVVLGATSDWVID